MHPALRHVLFSKVPASAEVVPLGLTYITALASTADAQNYTTQFLGLSIGTASSDRRIILCAVGRQTTDQTCDSATIDGNAMTRIAQSASNTTQSAIFIYHQPSGTTADFTVHFSAIVARCVVGVYAITGLTSDTPYDTASAIDTDPLSLSIDVNEGGVVIACGIANTTSATAWTPTANRTIDYDATTESTRMSFASWTAPTASAPLVAECDFGGAPTTMAGCAVSFG